MEPVGQVVTAYCQRLGGHPPAPREDGSYVLQFDGKYDVQFSAERRDRVLLRANLPQLTKDRYRQDTLRRLLRVNLVLSARKHATLSLDSPSDVPFLYDLVDVGGADLAPSLQAIT